LYWEKTGLDTLFANLFLYNAIEKKTMPNRSGLVMRLWDFSAMSANTTPATEGTPASGQALTDNTRDLTLSQFVDYISVSDITDKAHIVDMMGIASEQLGYRGALTVDTVISTAVDVAANADSNARIEVNDGSYMTGKISRQAAAQLRNAKIKPKANGLYFGVCSPLVSFDLQTDTNTNSVGDLQKYSESLASNNPALVGVRKNAFVAQIGGVEWFESAALPSETNWQSTTHNAYHNYVFGLNAFIGASLGNTALGQKNFAVGAKRFKAGDNVFDIGGQIALAAYYNFLFGVVKRTGSTAGYRRIRVESSIG
jgi:N4-gp56 family major capsid protein